VINAAVALFRTLFLSLHTVVHSQHTLLRHISANSTDTPVVTIGRCCILPLSEESWQLVMAAIGLGITSLSLIIWLVLLFGRGTVLAIGSVFEG
jgi:hypothetical protein